VRLLKEAQEANRLKDEFLAILSHELRTPMNAIVGWTAVLGSGAASPEQVRRGVEVIQRNVRAQSQLISDLLDVSRIVTGKLRLELRPVSAADPVREALETVRPAAEAKGVHLRTTIDTGIVVAADPDRLQQIAWNLLSNAVKFTPRDGEVRVGLHRLSSAMELVVADTGAGIEPAFLPYVFERFRQAEVSQTARQAGLGLGLAIARNLAEMHGGSISAESAGRGRGATFTVRLPLPILADPEKPAVAPPAASLAGLVVLLVDDEADSREIGALLLRRAGATVWTAPTVKEALALVARERPHVVVSDLDIPGEDGYALAEALRRDPAGAAIPLVALSAHAGEPDRRRSSEAGFLVHLTKPVEEDALLAAIARVAGPRPGP
jgi:CheY-like chemotaxis protein